MKKFKRRNLNHILFFLYGLQPIVHVLFPYFLIMLNFKRVSKKIAAHRFEIIYVTLLSIVLMLNFEDNIVRQLLLIPFLTIMFLNGKIFRVNKIRYYYYYSSGISLLIFLSVMVTDRYHIRYYQMINFFTRELNNTPGYGIFLMLPIALGIYGIFFQSSKKLKFLSLILLGNALWYSVIMVRRTPLIFFVVILIISSLKNLKNGVYIIIFLALAIWCIETMPQLKDLRILKRFSEEGLKSSRYKLWQDSFFQMLKYRYGGNNFYFGKYSAAHNYFLDKINEIGVVVIFFFFYYIYKNLKLLYKNLKEILSNRFQILDLLIAMSFFIGLMTEPPFSIHYLGILFFFLGTI